MQRTCIGMWLAVLATAMSGMAAKAQSQEGSHGLEVREVYPAVTPTPFPLDAKTGRPAELQFLAKDEMSAADQELVAANSAEIARRAGLLGFHLHDGPAARESGWGYEQAVCPVFPGHVVLEYSRSNGAGDISLFSAMIPRGAAGDHVRVIPVRRRSYSLWTPAASNTLTLHDFNSLVKFDGLDPDWLTTGLCYAALAGGHVRAALAAAAPEEERYPLLEPAKLTVSRQGGAEVLFADQSVKAMNWRFSFAQDGRLVKVQHSDADGLTKKAVPGTAAEVQGKPVAGNAAEVTGP